MFGFNKDKTETLVRLGWANLANDEGVKRLRKFVFTQAQLIERPGRGDRRRGRRPRSDGDAWRPSRPTKRKFRPAA
jgi:hypothetical protein